MEYEASYLTLRLDTCYLGVWPLRGRMPAITNDKSQMTNLK